MTTQNARQLFCHGLVTLTRVNIRVLLPMGTLKTCCGGVPVIGFQRSSSAGAEIECLSLALLTLSHCLKSPWRWIAGELGALVGWLKTVLRDTGTQQSRLDVFECFGCGKCEKEGRM
jgi:hypothetical protein